MAEAMYYQVADPSVLGRQYSALGQTFTVTDFDDDDLDDTVTMLRRMKNMMMMMKTMMMTIMVLRRIKNMMMMMMTLLTVTMKSMMMVMSPGCNCGQLFLRRSC